jgi:hypothetical protein
VAVVTLIAALALPVTTEIIAVTPTTVGAVLMLAVVVVILTLAVAMARTVTPVMEKVTEATATVLILPVMVAVLILVTVIMVIVVLTLPEIAATALMLVAVMVTAIIRLVGMVPPTVARIPPEGRLLLATATVAAMGTKTTLAGTATTLPGAARPTQPTDKKRPATAREAMRHLVLTTLGPATTQRRRTSKRPPTPEATARISGKSPTGFGVPTPTQQPKSRSTTPDLTHREPQFDRKQPPRPSLRSPSMTKRSVAASR